MTIAPEPSPSLDQPGPVGEGIEIALSNIYRMTRAVPSSLAAVLRPEDRAPLIAGLTELIAAEIRMGLVYLERFGKELASLGMPPPTALTEQAQARAILLGLNDWMIETRIGRSITNGRSLTIEWVVPPGVLKHMLELAHLGRALRSTWSVARTAHSVTPSAARNPGSPRMTHPISSRVYLMCRVWTGYPSWFEVEKVNDADDDALPARIVSYIRSRLKKIDKPTRDAFINGGGLTNLEEHLASGDRKLFTRWEVFGCADTDAAAALVIGAVHERLALAVTYNRLPRASLAPERWAILERELGALDQEIRDYDMGNGMSMWRSARPLPTLWRLRKEALEFAPIVADVPQGQGLLGEQHGAGVQSQPTKKVTHAPDYTWIRVGDRNFTFKKGQQADSIKFLHETWNSSGQCDGYGMTERALGAKLEASYAFRVAKLFHRHPALNTVLCRTDKGIWALFLNSPK